MDKSFGEILILSLFSRIAAVDSPLQCKAQLATVLGPDDGARYGFHLVDQALNPTRESLVTSMMSMALWCQWAHLARMVIIVAYKIHSWVKLIIIIIVINIIYYFTL